MDTDATRPSTNWSSGSGLLKSSTLVLLARADGSTVCDVATARVWNLAVTRARRVLGPRMVINLILTSLTLRPPSAGSAWWPVSVNRQHAAAADLPSNPLLRCVQSGWSCGGNAFAWHSSRSTASMSKAGRPHTV